MNEENESVDIQEVADPVKTSENMVEVAEQSEDVAQENQVQESNETAKNNTTQRDSAFAQMRRKSEKLEKENQRVQKENQRFQEALKRFGFNGNNSEEILDAMNAQYYGKSVEEIRNERIESERAMQEYDAMAEKLQRYEAKEIEEKMASDLASIQKINPEVKSLDDLGKPFFDLVSKGIDGVQAYKLLNFDELTKQQNIKVEQDVIQKMRANAKSGVGALDAEASKPKSVADMNEEEFEAYRQRALKGELRSY